MAIDLDREEQTRAHSFTVQQHGASSANTVLTADMSTRQAELVAQEVAQQQPRLDSALEHLAIDFDLHRVFRDLWKKCVRVPARKRLAHEGGSVYQPHAAARATVN